MKVAYFPGCLAESVAREDDMATRAVLAALEVELIEVPDWHCCGARTAPAVQPETALRLAAGNLVAAGEVASTLLAPCGICYGNFVAAQRRMRGDEELCRKLEAECGGELKRDLQILTLAELLGWTKLEKRIAGAIETPLEPFNIACYYGCALSRPAATVGALQAGTIEKLLRVLGAHPVAWDAQAICCGGMTAFARRRPGERLVRNILLAAMEAGANAICVACPACYFNLDTRQFEISCLEGRRVEMPVFFLSELVAGAMELDVIDKAFGRHMTSVYRLIYEFWDEDGRLKTPGATEKNIP